MGIPHISYSGSCTVNGALIFCRDASVNIESKPTFYDHTVGLVESKLGFGGSSGVAGTKIQKKYYRYAPVLPKASVSGLLTAGTASFLLDLARWGGNRQASGLGGSGGIDVVVSLWDQGTTQTLSSAYMQSLTIDLRAGDVASFSAEFVGQSISSASSGFAGSAGMGVLLTWDACTLEVINKNFSIDAGTTISDFSNVASFSVTVNNPVIPIYTANTPNLFPKELRLGIQETTGSISLYGSSSYLQGYADLVLKIALSSAEYSSYTFHAAFEPPSDKASASAIYLSTSNFATFSDSGRSWGRTGELS